MNPGRNTSTEPAAVHDDYKPWVGDVGPLERCPVCGSKAEVWQYSEGPADPVRRVVMCSNGERFGPQDGIQGEGCLLYMPPDAFYRETARDAARYWNEYARALAALRAAPADAWRAMAYAPLDGTEVELLVRHATWWTAKKSGHEETWEQIVRGHWIDFNGGGWSWSGMAGQPIGWRAAAALKCDERGARCANPKHTVRHGLTSLSWRCETCGGTARFDWD